MGESAEIGDYGAMLMGVVHDVRPPWGLGQRRHQRTGFVLRGEVFGMFVRQIDEHPRGRVERAVKTLGDRRARGGQRHRVAREGLRRAAMEIARRSRGTPRVAGRLLRRVRDFASVDNAPSITAEVADSALTKLEVDSLGLDAMDRRYLTMIAETYGGGPVGIETLAAGLAEPRDTL